MSSPTHQTIKLSKGKHSSPETGACVMELASMLAGEQFSDHPQTVCPMVGSFLRAYNDSIDETRRQDLYEYASRVVGSRADTDVERARADMLMVWSANIRLRRLRHSVIPGPIRQFIVRRRRPIESAGAHAVQAIRRHTDELLAVGDQVALSCSSTHRPPSSTASSPAVTHAASPPEIANSTIDSAATPTRS
jgi:hypothetical protein